MGDLSLQELSASLESLVEILLSQTPQLATDLEFLYFYDFLQSKMPKRSEVNKIVPASITISSLHPKIQEHCRSRFNSKHYSDAILTAYKVVLNEVKDITGIHDQDGKPLVELAFSLNNPITELNPLATPSERDEQLGFMFLFTGAAVGIRNPKAHDLVVQTDKQRTLEYFIICQFAHAAS